MAKFIAFYLPQFHPIPDNDKWYGKGFTEWTNVAKGRPLFKGHYQPHIPADLGFYDLRLRDTVVAQTELAKEYGVDGFCYWHYWFGNGKQLLEKPFQALIADKSIDFPFSLAWANETWEKKLWDKNKKNEIIAEQVYPGDQDYINHFYSLLKAFSDKRYIRVDGKLLFIIYRPLDCPDVSNMMNIWRDLATKEGLGDFYFVAKDFDCRDKDKLFSYGFDAIYNDTVLNIHHKLSTANKIRLKVQRDVFGMPTTFKYSEAIKYMITEDDKQDNIFPLIAPNWDHSPRSGRKSLILTDCAPHFFEKVVRNAVEVIQNKPEEQKIVMIRAWNEWGEGNHLEPDLKYGLGYLEAIKRVRNEMGI